MSYPVTIGSTTNLSRKLLARLAAVEKKSLVTFEVKAPPNHDFNLGEVFCNYLSFFRCKRVFVDYLLLFVG